MDGWGLPGEVRRWDGRGAVQQERRWGAVLRAHQDGHRKAEEAAAGRRVSPGQQDGSKPALRLQDAAAGRQERAAAESGLAELPEHLEPQASPQSVEMQAHQA